MNALIANHGAPMQMIDKSIVRVHRLPQDDLSANLSSGICPRLRTDRRRRHERPGGAMNSGPTGSVMNVLRMVSISALSVSSSDQPLTSPTGFSWSG